MLTLDDFSGMKFTSDKTPLEYLLDVTEVALEKYEKEEQLRINKQERRIPHIVDHQEKPILHSVIPKRKRSMPNATPRKVTKQSFCNGDESMIKKAVENDSENQENRVITNQEFVHLEIKTSDDRVFKINSKKRLANDTTLLCFDNQQQKKKVKRNITVRAQPPVPAPVELDIQFKNEITLNGGSLESLKLVIEKTLFKTDVEPAEGRFSIPQKKMSNSFLESEEDARLNTRNGGNMCEMRVMLIEPSRGVSEIKLRKWLIGKGSMSYVLVTYWNEVVRRNHLRIGSKVQLWAFRKGTQLCFALVKLED